MKRIATYSRCSTSDQRPEIQAEALRAYCERRGAECVEFIDRGQSGAKDRRPALDRLMAAVRRREVDAVACTKIDRIARSVRHLTQVGAELEALGVALIVLDQQIDTGVPSGKLLFHLLGAIGEFERDLCIERTRAGLAAARRRGARIGRPQALTAEDLARAARLRAAGHSIRGIAELLNVSKSTIERALSRIPPAPQSVNGTASPRNAEAGIALQ